MVSLNAATAAATAAPSAPQALVLGEGDDPNMIGTILVKFTFKKLEMLPSHIIPQVDRMPSYKLDVARQLEMYRLGEKQLGALNRVRKGRVDTGTQVIKMERPVHAGFLRRGIANRGFRLSHLHWFKMEDTRDTKGQKEPAYVVVACFVRGNPEAKPTSQQVEALRALANMTWNKLYVWENQTGNPATINFVGRAPGQKPKLSAVVRDGSVVLEDVSDVITEERE